MSLIDDGACTTTVIPSDNCFYEFFLDCSNLITAPELPATTLKYGCYFSMFMQCTNLISAPELPATTLAEFCYADMFLDCTNLISAPELHATTLVYGCYTGMFGFCRLLNYIKCLATNPDEFDYTFGWL